MSRFLMFFLLVPAIADAWILNDECELTHKTAEGTVAVAPAANGILLHLPDGLVADDTWVRVGIGNSSWRERVVGGTVELDGGVDPFLKKSWVTVHADADRLLGLSLVGSSAGWERLEDCELPPQDGWLTLSGEITSSTDDRIIAAIRSRRPEGLVLDSVGGLSHEAQRIGHRLRAAGMSTKVEADGQCLSECVFILAAGVRRIVESGARVDVTPSLITKGLGEFRADAGQVSESAVYFTGMGLDGGRLAVVATSPTHDDAHLFTPAELRDLGFVDTTAPVAAINPVFGRSTGPDGDVWRWLLRLLGIGVILWSLTKIWNTP